MSFSYPYVLATLVVPVILIARVWKRHERRVVLPFDHGRQRPGTGWRVLVDLAECLPSLLLAIVILVLSGPQRLGEPKSERLMTNIEFCVDVSGSMGMAFGDETRYDVSMRSIDDFLVKRQGDAFGLMFFANNVIEWVPLTFDASALRCAPPFMKPERAPPWMQGTMIGKALRESKKILAERAEGDRMVIVVSDGESADLFNGQDEAVAKELKAENIVVYYIHVAPGDPTEAMGVIASLTGGESFAAGDGEGLKNVFKKIESMQQTKLKKRIAETLDDFEPYAIAGLSVLGLATLSLFGVRYNPW